MDINELHKVDTRHWTEIRQEKKMRIAEIKEQLAIIDLAGADNEFERAKRIRKMINLEDELFDLEYYLMITPY